MRTVGSILILLLVVACDLPAEDQAFRIAELPRPNSGTFSFQQAEARKLEILTNVPTPKLELTDLDFCIHIEKDDTITVYNHLLKAFAQFSKPRTNQSVADVTKIVDTIPRWGREVRILVTSDAPLKDSKTIHEVLRSLFVPSIQLLYASRNK